MESRHYEEQCEIKTRAHSALHTMKAIEKEKKLYEAVLPDKTIVRSNSEKRLKEYVKYISGKKL